jgi:hypothetical protein
MRPSLVPKFLNKLTHWSAFRNQITVITKHQIDGSHEQRGAVRPCVSADARGFLAIQELKLLLRM